jgi:hypothetical protein
MTRGKRACWSLKLDLFLPGVCQLCGQLKTGQTDSAALDKNNIAHSVMHSRLQNVVDAIAPVVRNAIARTPCLPQRYHLGVDVSSSHVGLALLASDGSTLHTAVCTSKKASNMWEFAGIACSAMHGFVAGRQLASATVEEALKHFAAGRFSSQGVFKLAQLNAIIVHELRTTAAAPVRLVTPNAVRALWDVPAAVRAAAAVAADAASSAATADALIDNAPPLAAASSAAVPQAPASANATKVAAMHLVTAAFPGLTAVWGRGSRTGLARASDYDRSDAILLAMTGVAQGAQAACFDTPGVFDACLRAAAPAMLPLRGAKGLSADDLVARLSWLHDHNVTVRSPAASPGVGTPARVPGKRRMARSAASQPPTPEPEPPQPLPHESTLYSLCRSAVQQAVVDSLLRDVWPAARTAVVDDSARA